MAASSARNVTSSALISKIPAPHQRAGFMSVMSSIQHMMSGLGAMASTLLLTETPEHRLAGIDGVALIAMAAFAVVPWMMFKIEKWLKIRGLSSTPAIPVEVI